MHDLIKKQCIGLTGGIATGKSTVAAVLRAKGFLVFDADQLARAVVAPGRPALRDITALFGSGILDERGGLDRKKLGQVVFNAPEKRAQLEAITHPRIREEFENELKAAQGRIGSKPFFYEAALLFEAGRADEFSKILCTWCPEPVQLARLMQRNQLSEAEARSVLNSQMPASAKRDRADLVIDTDCSLEELRARIDAVFPTQL